MKELDPRGSRLRLRRRRRARDDEARASLDARRRHRRRRRPAGGRRETRARPVRVLEPRKDPDRNDLRLRGSSSRAAAAARPRPPRRARAREPRRAVVPARQSRRRVPGEPRRRAGPRARHAVGFPPMDFGDNIWDVEFDGPTSENKAAEKVRLQRARQAAYTPTRLLLLSSSVWELEPGCDAGAVPLPSRRRGAPDRAAWHSNAAVARRRASS